jgi:tRNA1(Val) A37 N6-methylase TrmN6
LSGCPFENSDESRMTERKYSEDTLFDGRLICMQHKRGYRFSIDAVLLAHFIKPRLGARVLEIGGGCGVISLILAYRYQQVGITVLELQDDLADLIRRNIEQNDAQTGGFKERIEVVHGDLRTIDQHVQAGTYDWVVCNPPYRRSGSGRVNPASEQAVARHELQADLKGVVGACAYGARTRGRVALVYPAVRGVSLLHAMRNQGLEPKRLQVVYSYPGSEARLLLVEAVKGGGEELLIEPPLYIYKEQDGDYTEEMAACYEP